MSIFLDIRNRYDELYDGEDESTLLKDLLGELSEEKRLLWEEESMFYFEMLPECDGSVEPIEAIEPLIMAKFEDGTA